MCGEMLWQDNTQQLEEISILEANQRCQVHVQFKGATVPSRKCENHARKMRTFFTRRLEPKTKSSNAFKWSLRPKRK